MIKLYKRMEMFFWNTWISVLSNSQVVRSLVIQASKIYKEEVTFKNSVKAFFMVSGLGLFCGFFLSCLNLILK